MGNTVELVFSPLVFLAGVATAVVVCAVLGLPGRRNRGRDQS